MEQVYYQHRYGGIYRVDHGCATNTVDGSEWVVYTHVFPFEKNTFIRPRAEFCDGRFVALSDSELDRALSNDAAQARINIGLNRARGV